jgi:hypothetical protein
MLIGAQVAGATYNNFLAGAEGLTPEQWQQFWWLPAGFALVVLIIFGAFFSEQDR